MHRSSNRAPRRLPPTYIDGRCLTVDSATTNWSATRRFTPAAASRLSVITIIDGLAITIIDGRLNQVHRHPAAPLMPLTADLPRIHAGQLLLAAGRRDRLGRPLGEVPASPRLLYRGEDSLSPRAPLPPEMDGAASAARRRKRPYVARAAFRSQHTLRRGNGNGGPVTPTDALVKRRVSANAAPRQAAQKEHDN